MFNGHKYKSNNQVNPCGKKEKVKLEQRKGGLRGEDIKEVGRGEEEERRGGGGRENDEKTCHIRLEVGETTKIYKTIKAMTTQR